MKVWVAKFEVCLVVLLLKFTKLLKLVVQEDKCEKKKLKEKVKRQAECNYCRIKAHLKLKME